MKHYDAIIIGGGLNSLLTAMLLAKEKKSVILFESKNKIGGMASMEEFHPGFKCNLIHDYLPLMNDNLMKKLQLDKLNLKFHDRDPLHIALDNDEKHLIFSNDIDQTIASIARHSSKDADKWPYFINYIDKLTQFLIPLYFSIPPKISDIGIKDAIALKEMFRPIKKHGSRGFVDFLRTAPMMMPELMDEWFESELLRGNLSAKGVLYINQGPYSAATTLNFLHQNIFSNGNIFNSLIMEGGIESFIQKIYDVAIKRGVTMMLNTHIKKINCKNDICIGVTTFDDKQYTAKNIISGIDPNNTFLKLIGSTNINPKFRRQLNNIKYVGSTARIHFALNNLPRIPGIKKEEMNAIFSINPSIEYIEKAHDDIKYGQYSKNPHMEFSFPSILNPDMAPLGKQVLSATVQHIPHKLKNATWNEKIKETISQKIILIIEKHIPNFSQYIEHSMLMTPIDFENAIGITEGNINHGEMTLDQFYFMRPTMSSAQYNTPIKNLFLCGPGTHPGGGLHGINALNAVKRILNT